eukprot:SAG31_NODE_1099_length_9914_cov_6.721345_8_plen_224_part_00
MIFALRSCLSSHPGALMIDWACLLVRFSRRLLSRQGDEYDGITKEDAVVVDTANFFGLISEEPAGPVTSWENITEAQIQAWASFFGPGAIAAQAREAAWRMETTRRTSPGNPNPTVVGVGRRRLESSGPPVGQEFLAQLGRDHVTAAGPLSPPPTPTHRRRLDNHDEWGGVSLSLKLAKYGEEASKPCVLLLHRVCKCVRPPRPHARCYRWNLMCPYSLMFCF